MRPTSSARTGTRRPVRASCRSSRRGATMRRVRSRGRWRSGVESPSGSRGTPMSDVTEIRDPKTDELLTPQNAVIAFIDYQPEQYAGVKSVDRDELLAHVTMLGRVATTFGLP